ncbi:MAG: ABC transporter permease [Christensenellales bacterium]
MSFLKALRLKFQELLAAPLMLGVLVILPMLLGLVAGAANVKNQSPQIRLAITDLDKTAYSTGLIASLERQGWDVLEVPQEALQRLIDGKAVDGALLIAQGFSAGQSSLTGGGLTYTPAEGSLSTNLVLDAVTYAVIPFKSRSVFLRQAKALFSQAGASLPEGFDALYDERIRSYQFGNARQEFIMIGEYVEPSALTYVVNDYSMEVLFLGIFALLGSFQLSSPALRRRLCATPFGSRYDYIATLVTLFLCGVAQILLYMLSMRGLMQTAFKPQELYLLSVFLLMSLALSQILSLLHQSLRLYVGLIVLLLLSVAGGCFLQLPQQMISTLGQYLPQGWTLAALRGYPVPPVVYPVGLSLLTLALVYPLRAGSGDSLRLA